MKALGRLIHGDRRVVREDEQAEAVRSVDVSVETVAAPDVVAKLRRTGGYTKNVAGPNMRADAEGKFRYRGKGKAGNPGPLAFVVKDLDHAIIEITTARRELKAAYALTDRHERRHALVEPRSRLDLVRRYLDEILGRSERQGRA